MERRVRRFRPNTRKTRKSVSMVQNKIHNVVKDLKAYETNQIMSVIPLHQEGLDVLRNSL